MISMIFASGPDVIRLSRFNQTNYPLDYSSRFLLFPIFQNLFLITSHEISIEAGEWQARASYGQNGFIRYSAAEASSARDGAAARVRAAQHVTALPQLARSAMAQLKTANPTTAPPWHPSTAQPLLRAQHGQPPWHRHHCCRLLWRRSK